MTVSKWLATDFYLAFSVAVNLFRVTIYLFQQEEMGRVKVSPEAWRKPEIREIMFHYTEMIRLLMAFRALVSLTGLFFEERLAKRFLCTALFSLDLWIWTSFARSSEEEKRKKGSVMQHQKGNWPPFLIQCALTLAGTAFHFLWLGGYLPPV